MPSLSFLPSFLYSLLVFLHSFIVLPSFLPSFLPLFSSRLPPYLHLPSFLPSFLYSLLVFLHIFIFLPSVLALFSSRLPPYLHLPSVLHFLHFLPSFSRNEYREAGAVSLGNTGDLPSFPSFLFSLSPSFFPPFLPSISPFYTSSFLRPLPPGAGRTLRAHTGRSGGAQKTPAPGTGTAGGGH